VAYEWFHETFGDEEASPTSLQAAETHLRLYILPFFGPRRDMTTLTKADVVAFVDFLAAREPGPRRARMPARPGSRQNPSTTQNRASNADD
jgi:hypothetical protein